MYKVVVLAIASLFVPLGVFLGVITNTRPALAATSSTLNFQGRLLSNTGSVVADGTYNIQFNLYTVSSGGSTQWTETYLNTTTPVTLKYGYFSVQLGSLTSFPSTINWDQEQWLGMTVRGTGSCAFGACTPTDAEMTPRFKLTAVPYAFRAGSAAAVATNDTNTAATNTSAVTVVTGNSTNSGNTGAITIATGNATSGNSGNISIDAGTATGTAGQLLLGTANASVLTIGRAGLTTTTPGGFSVGQALAVTGNTTLTGDLAVNGNTTIGNANTDRLTFTAQVLGASPLVFQGATDNGFTTTFAITDPTANNTITFPDASGTVLLAPTGSGNGLVQVPTSNSAGVAGANIIAPTAASIVGLTVNGTTGTAATALAVVQGGAASALTLTANNITTQTAASVTSTGTLTTTGNLLTVTANNATTSTGVLTVNATGLTTGYAQNINVNGAAVLTTGGALNIVGPTGAANLSGGTGLLQIAAAGAFTTTANVGGLLQVAGNATTSGTVASFSGTGTTTGTVLRVTGNSSTASTTALTLDVSGGRTNFTPTVNITAAAGSTWNGLNIAATTATLTGSTGVTTATGFNLFSIAAPTITDASAVTVTNAASAYIAGAPIQAGSVTITNPYALWVDNGVARFDGRLELGQASTTAGLLRVFNTTNANTIDIQAGTTSSSYTLTLPTSVGSANQCLQNSGTAGILTFAGCASGATLQAAYDTDADGSDTIIALTTADDSIIFRNPASSGTDSTYVLTVDQLATGAVGGLSVQSAGTGNLLLITDTTATGRDVLRVADGGATTLRNQTDSTAALQVQSASAGTAVFTVDTTNSQTILRGVTSDAVVSGTNIAASTVCSGTNWSGTGPWTHATGSTVALTCTLPASVTTGATYQVTYTVASNSTATDTVLATLGGVAAPATGENTTHTVVITTTGTTGVTFTPTTNFNGTVNTIVINLITNSKSVLTVQNSTGASTVEIRSGSDLLSTFVGLSAGSSNSTGTNNAGFGTYSLMSNTTGISNTASGARSLQNNTTGSYNSAFGQRSLQNNTTGSTNTALGRYTLFANTTGSSNVAVGGYSLQASTTGNNNVAVGMYSSQNNTTGTRNSALGSDSLNSNTIGGNNVAVGASSLYNNTTGSYNTALGSNAGDQDSNGFRSLNNLSNTTLLGYAAQVQASNSLILGGQGSNAVNVGIGTTMPSNTLSVSAVQYSTGTASIASSGTTVTGSGTTFTSAMVGSEIIIDSGSASVAPYKGTITAFSSTTSITVTPAASAAISGQNYRIHYVGLQVKNNGDTQLGGNLLANTVSASTTGTATAVAGTNTTTILLTAAGVFANNDVIFINNAGQDYYTRITAGGGTTTLTVSPAISYDASATITKYNTQNIGATATDYTTQSNRFFQGYFLGGVVTGAGSTTLSDQNLTSSGGLYLNTGGNNPRLAITSAGLSTFSYTDYTSPGLNQGLTVTSDGEAEILIDPGSTGDSWNLSANDDSNLFRIFQVTAGVATARISVNVTATTLAGNLAVSGTGTSTIGGDLTVSGTGTSSFAGALNVGTRLSVTSGGYLTIADAGTAVGTSMLAVGDDTFFSDMDVANTVSLISSTGGGVNGNLRLGNSTETGCVGGKAYGISLYAGTSCNEEFLVASSFDNSIYLGPAGTNADVFMDLGPTGWTQRLCHSAANGVDQQEASIADCTAAGQADLAEMYDTHGNLEPGDVVYSEGGYMVNKTNTAFDQRAIGVVSTNPTADGIIGNNVTSENRQPIALAGRIPVKVSLEAGVIEVGDYLTPASTPGFVMKATSASRVVGVAMENYDGSQARVSALVAAEEADRAVSHATDLDHYVSNPALWPAGTAKIMMFVNPTFYSPSSSSVLQGTGLNITGNSMLNGNLQVNGDLTVTGQTTLATLTVTGNTTLVTLTVTGDTMVQNITVNGKIITSGAAPTVAAGTAAGTGGSVAAAVTGNDTAGTFSITTGSSSLVANDILGDLTFTSPYSQAPIVTVSPTSEDSAGLRFYIIKTTTGWSIKVLDAPIAGKTYSFDYHVIQ